MLISYYSLNKVNTAFKKLLKTGITFFISSKAVFGAAFCEVLEVLEDWAWLTTEEV